MTLEVDGRTIDAVAEVSKRGFTYVFDRVTGEPVWPIEKRPVDTETDMPGEVPYPTQPFPTRPPPFAARGVSLDDANDLTPEIHRLAVEEQTYRLGPLFTPPSLRGTLQRPRVDGGANRGGGRSIGRPTGSTSASRRASRRTWSAKPTPTCRRSAVHRDRDRRRARCALGGVRVPVGAPVVPGTAGRRRAAPSPRGRRGAAFREEARRTR